MAKKLNERFKMLQQSEDQSFVQKKNEHTEMKRK